MELTEDQVNSVDFLVDAILTKKDVVGFIAPGGCGKTFSLRHLSKDARLKDQDVIFTATTNKAASVMKREGVDKAMTLHAAISSHIPTDAFREVIIAYDIYRKEKLKIELSERLINLIESFGVKAANFYDYNNEKDLLAKNKVDSFDDRVFSHFSTAGYKGGAVFIDEASMLPTKSFYGKDGKLKAIGLDITKDIYDTVVLVGDDSQLPPINGKSSFEDIEKTVLTENLRADSSLLRVLDYVRSGNNIANYVPEDDEPVKIFASLSDAYFIRDDLIENNVTHIVYRNKTRKEITHKIRSDLDNQPIKHEPIVYKGATIDEEGSSVTKNETGVFNGVVGEWEDYKQAVDGRNFDEYGDGYTYLQYGYAITAHTSQGSSFDHVIVHVDDIPHFIDQETRRKWCYTAISRARKSIVIVY